MTYFSTEPLPSSLDSSDIRRLRALFPIGNCQRIAGPPLPPPAQTEALRNEGPVPYLLERLERLAYGERTTSGNPPPVETYRTEPGSAGDVYRATAGYLRWYSSQYGIDIDQVPTPRSPAVVPAEEQAPAGDRPRDWRAKRMKAA